VSRIDDLIRRHCSHGVVYLALGDVGEVFRGRRFTKADYVERGTGAIHYGELYTHYGTSATDVITQVRTDLAPNLRFVKPGDVVIAEVGETLEDVGKAVAWLGTEEVAIHDGCYGFRSELNPVFVAYYLQTAAFHAEKNRHVARAKVKRLSINGLRQIRVPVPPLEVQEEIVRVLDSFQSLEAELEARLELELEARRRQSAYYRAMIVQDDMAEHRWVRLHEVADIAVGFPFKSAGFSDDPTAWALIRGDNVGQGTLKARSFKRWHRSLDDGLADYELVPGDVVVAMDRPWIPAGLKWARICEGDLPALLVQRVARLRARSGVLDQRFLGCLVSSAAFTEHVLRIQTGNTVPHISGAQIGSFRFRLPTLAGQERVAATLEKFDGLVNDLSIGLPAELAARRKQYEYYRDRLLSFEEAA
jgi:type I restriction enzyme S subunit